MATSSTQNDMWAILLPIIIREAPALAIEIVQLFSKGEPTEADWAALKAKYSGKTYAQYLAEAQAANP